MKRWQWHILILVACGALAYANALSGPFVFDDGVMIEDNPDIRQLWPPAWALPSAAPHGPVNGRPLTSFTLALNYAWGGLAVEGFHLGNLVLHVLCALVLYGTVHRLLARVDRLAPRARSLALVCALLWSVHPLNSEIVNYITQRSASLMALCYMATLYCFLRYAERGGRWGGGAVACCALGMGAKEVMVSAPLAVLLCDRLFVSGAYGAALRLRPKFYAGLACGWLVLLPLLWARPHGPTIGFDQDVGAWTYLLNQAQMIATYLRLALWPHPLALDYGIPRALTLADVWWQGALVLGLLVWTGVAVYRGQRWSLVGAIAFMALAPTSSFVPILTEVGAERRMYLPLAALIAGLVAAGDGWSGRWRYGRRVSAVLAGLAVVAAAGQTAARNADYASGISIWRTAVAAVPDNPRAHYNLGNRLKEAGDAAQAAVHYRRALALDPDAAGAHNNLGQVLVALGDAASALDHYRRALELQPGSADVHVNTGLALEWLDRVPEALTHYRRAVELASASAWARYNFGIALERSGAWDEAAQHYRAAVAIDPDMAQAHFRLGRGYAEAGQSGDAAHHLQRSLALDRGQAEAHFYLGLALSRLDQTAASLAHYRRAVELDPQLVEAHYYLGTALVRAGHYAEALPHLRQVVALAPESAEGRNGLGVALLALGQRVEAVGEFRHALELRPEYVEARANLDAVLGRGVAP